MKNRRIGFARAMTLATVGLFGPLGIDRAHAQYGGGGVVTTKPEPRTLSVQGHGKISAKPDSVHIQVGVGTDAPTARKALADNNEAMNRLFTIVKERGVAEKDIQTSQISVRPMYSQPPPPRPGVEQREYIPKIIGYRVDNHVSIRSREIAKLGALLDAVVEGGANEINGINFRIDDTDMLMVEARKRAMADAKSKASLIAGEARMVLGVPITIEEETHLPSHPGGRADPMMRMAGAVEPMPIAAGEQDLSVHVSIVYEIKVP